MSLYQDLEQRGIVKQTTDPGVEKAINSDSLTLYCGFDPTSDSLHVGSLLPIVTLKRFQMAGHKPIALVGGATGMIGDPSGKSAERNLLNKDQLNQNVEGIKKVISRFLDFGGGSEAQLVNNYDWFQGFGYIDFLRDVGKHFTVNHMMGKESVRARLEDREHGISYTEFSYMLLQAYDFYHLNQSMGCTLQVGGSDQWGNITAGCELVRRMRAAGAGKGKTDPLFGLTHPLVTKADGTKFGKTEKGTIWLTADRTSPYDFYQFFIQTADADVINYLNFFTFLNTDEIAELKKSVQTEPEKRMAQKKLAEEMTRLVHGEEELKKAQGAAKGFFSGDVTQMDEASLVSMLKDAPSTAKSQSDLGSGLPLVDLLVESGLSKSKGAARRDCSGGGIYLNGKRADGEQNVTTSDLLHGKYVVLRKGKKNYHLISFS